MARFHATSNGMIPFSQEEEAARDLEESISLSEQKNILAADTRKKRDEMLSNSDWKILRAFENNELVNQDWKNYRQALRDIPAQSGFPENVVWPQPPA